VKRRLERVPLPDEHGAEERAWNVVRAAYEQREPVAWPRRHARPLAFAAMGVAIVAAAVTPPGQSVVNSVRDAVGRDKVVGVKNAHRELVRLPAAGPLLVQSPRGAWVVQASGSRRLLPGYAMASWSPHGKFVVGVRYGIELVALEPGGNVHWARGRKQQIAFPRWSYEGYRIAYLSDDTLRIITGDGLRDWGLGSADARVAPAWRPGTHDVAYVTTDGFVHVVDADSRSQTLRVHVGRVSSLVWSSNGNSLLAVGPHAITVVPGGPTKTPYAPTPATAIAPARYTAAAFRPGSQTFTYAIARPGGRSAVYVGTRRVFTGAAPFTSLAWSPDGQWLAVGWPAANQFVFIRIGPHLKLYAVSNVARQFDPSALGSRFPTIAGWCCTS
jgi:hypothetical protein